MHIIPRFLFPLVLFLAAPAWVHAQQTQPQNPAVDPAERQVTGFRSARFGMTLEELREAIAKDFKPAPNAVSEVDNPAERTKVVVVQLPTLEPGPGPAAVSYILGARSRRLVHVNVVWTTGATPSESLRNEIAAGGVLLADYFRNQKWKPNGTTGGVPDGPNGVALFIGVDRNNAAAEVRISGVTVAGANGPGPAPSGPAQLRVSYIADIANPDVATIKPGSF